MQLEQQPLHKIFAQTNSLTQLGAYEGDFSFNGGPGASCSQPLAGVNDNRG